MSYEKINKNLMNSLLKTLEYYRKIKIALNFDRLTFHFKF
ncbi:hypothetical protein ADICYQ_4363 [Cyclobacterium qasimii M12-11B]|uniref:Uncharacterized protein n=1 Tax=Cyclobacterium qasimii M12-11B TaxID=641524 RepID=S7V9I7_9BACT|nr:hypothetical protein ADICYQ_4363 [Cyclobacterium qasimii M12-11B]